MAIIRRVNFNGSIPGVAPHLLPALQTPNTKFGLEQCSGIVDFGIVWFNIDNDGSFEWQTSITRNI
jgi:hypothetical protein